MKEIRKKNKKLTSVDFGKMWGGDGPYSQVNVIEQTRILDDSISRVFLVIEAEINPFTFEYIKKNRKKFENDEVVLQLLDSAEDRGKFGYVIGAGEVEITAKGARLFAEKQRDVTIEALIRMHAFVLNEFDIAVKKDFGVIEDGVTEKQFVWNDKDARVEVIEELLFDDKTFVGSQSGVKNNRMRFFFVIAFEKGFDFKSESVLFFIEILKMLAKVLKIEVEDCEASMEYMLITVLIPFDIPPAEFIEAFLDKVNRKKKKKIFSEKFFVTNTKMPTTQEIIAFLKGV